MSEKFSVFTEKSTGVNPFYLPPPPFPTALGLLLAFFRSLLLAASLPLLLLCDAACGSLGGSPLLYRALCGPLSRCVLFALGFNVGGVQSRVLRPGQDIAWRRAGAAAGGGGGGGGGGAGSSGAAVLLVNSSSWLDPLVLLAVHGAPLALPCAAGGAGFAAPSLWRALARALRRGPPPPPLPPPAAPLAPAATVELLRRWAGPLAVQVEGAPSNGRALLRAAPRLAGALEGALAALAGGGSPPRAPPPPPPRVLAISYGRAGAAGAATPAFCGGTPPWRHALALMAQAGNTVTVSELPAGAGPLPADAPQGAPPGAWVAAAQGAMEALLRRADGQLRLVALGEEDHRRFLGMAAAGAGEKSH